MPSDNYCCNVCGRYKPCPCTVDSVSGTWRLCEDCYKLYRSFYNKLSEEEKERFINRNILIELNYKVANNPDY